MSNPLITLNATVAEIEDALLTGKRVQDVARDLAEPPNNVYGVYCSLVERGKIKDDRVATTKRPDLTVARQQTTGLLGSAPRPVPAPSPPSATPVAGGGAEPTLDALINASVRSTSKRTQALGAKLGELAGVVRQRLRDEREQAEAKAREAEVREKAAAEVAELEQKLAAARAKLKGQKASRSTSRPSASGIPARSPEAMARLREAAYGEFPCTKGCGKVAATKAGRGSHERHCTGGVS